MPRVEVMEKQKKKHKKEELEFSYGREKEVAGGTGKIGF